LRSIYIVDIVVLVCHDDIRNVFDMLDSFEVIDACENLARSYVAVVFKPDQITLEMLREKFNFDDKEIHDDSLSWLSCKKYYVGKFSLSSAVLFECSLSKKWLDEVGLREARSEIYGWAIKSLATIESKGEKQ
jgi:hypothetical protein